MGCFGWVFYCQPCLEAILALTRHSTADGPKDMKKSAVRGYANELLLLTVRSTENVEFLTR